MLFILKNNWYQLQRILPLFFICKFFSKQLVTSWWA